MCTCRCSTPRSSPTLSQLRGAGAPPRQGDGPGAHGPDGEADEAVPRGCGVELQRQYRDALPQLDQPGEPGPPRRPSDVGRHRSAGPRCAGAAPAFVPRLFAVGVGLGAAWSWVFVVLVRRGRHARRFQVEPCPTCRILLGHIDAVHGLSLTVAMRHWFATFGASRSSSARFPERPGRGRGGRRGGGARRRRPRPGGRRCRPGSLVRDPAQRHVGGRVRLAADAATAAPAVSARP